MSYDLSAVTVLDSLSVDSSCVESGHLPVSLTIKVARAGPHGKEPAPMKGEWTEKLNWESRKVNTFLAISQSNAFRGQLQQARNEIRSDINRALQTSVDCLQAADACMVKKVKYGGSGRASKWFDKECFDCRKLTRSKLRRYRRTKTH